MGSCSPKQPPMPTEACFDHPNTFSQPAALRGDGDHKVPDTRQGSAVTPINNWSGLGSLGYLFAAGMLLGGE